MTLASKELFELNKVFLSWVSPADLGLVNSMVRERGPYWGEVGGWVGLSLSFSQWTGLSPPRCRRREAQCGQGSGMAP